MIKIFRERLLIPLSGFLVTLVLVTLLSVYFATNLLTQSEQKFDRQTSELTTTLSTNFSNYVNFLKDVQGLFASSSDVNRTEFSTFIKNVDFVSRYPGITLIAFSEKTSNADKQALFDELNADRNINPNGGIKFIPPTEEKDTYYFLNYAEPFTDTTAFGFDSSSNESRRINIQKAIEINDAVMTEKLPLTGVNAGQFSFSVYLPIYREGTVNNTKEERIANNTGVILGSFRLNNVFSKIYSDTSQFHDLSLEIYTDGIEDDTTKLFDSNIEITSANTLDVTLKETIANREWNLKFQAPNTYGLSETERSVPVLTFIAGFIFSILVAIFLFYLRKSQAQALELASSFKVKLDESEARMNSILESVDIIAYAINTQGIFTLSSGKGLEDLGLKQHDLEGKSVFEVYKENPTVVDQIKRALKGETIKETVPVGNVTLESRITPIFDKDNKVLSIVGISHNITDSEAANEKLKTKTDELEKLNKIMINRELKMRELKDQITKLTKQ